MRQLEDDLNSFKQQNRELQDELEKKTQELDSESSSEEDNSERIEELETQVEQLEGKVQEQERKVQEQEQKVQEQEQKIQEQDQKVDQLQKQLEEIRRERDNLQKQLSQMEKERDEEMKIVQMVCFCSFACSVVTYSLECLFNDFSLQALEDALEEKALVKCQFERDFEKLRTVNTDREQHLLDDFEWKLREVEQACKRRLEEKDKNMQKQTKDLEIKLKLAQQQLAEVGLCVLY